MLTDLVIDGNYILSKLVFTLNKNNLLFGALHTSLENSINNYKSWYPFSNIYLVSDSKEKSWRKKLIGKYKTNRKRDSDIDWEFVYNSYGEVKEGLKGIKVLEAPHIEGDDWISFLTEKANSNGRSVIIISNDYDIKQVIKTDLDKLTINVMSNEMYNGQKVFMPKNYNIFLHKVASLPNSIFELNNNDEFLKLLRGFVNKYEVNEIDPIEELFIKLVSGDKSDNIDSAWFQVKNGRKRGIGEKGAKSIYEQYLSEFGDIDLEDNDLYENIADLICEKKKLSKNNIYKIVSNIEKNSKLIDLRLSNLPQNIIDKMIEKYGQK